jgi:hypothetical protein
MTHRFRFQARAAQGVATIGVLHSHRVRNEMAWIMEFLEGEGAWVVPPDKKGESRKETAGGLLSCNASCEVFVSCLSFLLSTLLLLYFCGPWPQKSGRLDTVRTFVIGVRGWGSWRWRQLENSQST